ncbi:MAG: contractile injection system protein, VgrG/Pvc8 family [Clostridia bacterium]|nr:contractile injection system protein, VgrG/Pvc8 family [Clostridia bacterium]
MSAGAGAPLITYDNIKISPFEIRNLLELKIEKRMNEHARLYFTGIVPEGQRDRYVELTESKTEITVDCIDEGAGNTNLFRGIATNVEIKSVRDIYYIEVEALSFTYDLDIKLKSRSFQDEGMIYTQLVEEVIADYPGADFIDTAAKSKKTEKFIIQYNETDWEFLKRIASHFNTGLVPDALSGKPKFWFGIPEGGVKGRLEDFHYSVRKKIFDFRNSSENYIKGIDENDFTYFEVETDKVLNIGDSVSFKDKALYVYQSVAMIKNSTFKHQYILAFKNGFSQNTLFNSQIAGASVEGRVIDIKEDNLRVHLEIDDAQEKEKAYWFPYATFYTTEGNTGWYCMPQLDDFVKLYFPTSREEEGIIMNSIRRRTKGGDFITDPNVKFFRTIFGKEITFSEKEIMISAKDGEVLMRLIEDKGIEIYSKLDIRVKADENIVIESGKTIQISASDAIGIQCKESGINMDGTTSIKGSKVRTN